MDFDVRGWWYTQSSDKRREVNLTLAVIFTIITIANCFLPQNVCRDLARNHFKRFQCAKWEADRAYYDTQSFPRVLERFKHIPPEILM